MLVTPGKRAPIAQLAEAVDLKSIQSEFESRWGHTQPKI